MLSNVKDLHRVGEQHGSRTILGGSFPVCTKSGNSARYVVVKCSCGNADIVLLENALRSRSCKVCHGRRLNRDHCTTHGGKRLPEYAVWQRMKRRCYYPRDDSFSFYGRRGVRVCDRWKNSFANFLSDMGPRPTQNHSIDRVDVDGDYSPENCRWATTKEQSRNTRRNKIITVSMCVTDWANLVGISRETISARLKAGWEPRDALFRSVRQQRGQGA